MVQKRIQNTKIRVPERCCFFRQIQHGGERLLVVSNMTPVPRTGYRVDVPEAGYWREVINTDAGGYGGGNLGNGGGAEAESADGTAWLRLTLPPLATIVLKGPSAAGR